MNEPLASGASVVDLDSLLAGLRAAVPAAEVRVEPGAVGPNLVVESAQAIDVLTYLKASASPRFSFLTDLTAVDLLPREPRFEVIYLLTSLDPPARLIAKVPVGAENPTVRSAVALWPSANWLEREIYDLFGIRFEGHPGLTRILLPDDWEGHPLRKDFPLVEEPVEFVDHVPKVPSQIIPNTRPRTR